VVGFPQDTVRHNCSPTSACNAVVGHYRHHSVLGEKQAPKILPTYKVTQRSICSDLRRHPPPSPAHKVAHIRPQTEACKVVRQAVRRHQPERRGRGGCEFGED